MPALPSDRVGKSNFLAAVSRRSAPLRQPERPPLPDQLRHVLVHDAATVLDGVVARDDELGPVVPYLLERAVLAVLSRPIVHDGHRHLHVGVLHLGRAHDEVALELADAPHAHLVAQAPRVAVDDILEHRPVVDAVVRVEREVEAQVGEVVLLLALKRLARLHVEARALADNLCVLEYLEVAVERLPLDAHALALEVREDVRKRGRRTEVVDDVIAHPVKDRDVLHLRAPADVLLENLPDDGAHVGALVCHLGVAERLGKAALENVAVELDHGVWVDLLPKEALHLAVLLEAERLHLELDVAPRQLGGQLAGEQVGVRSGDEDGESALGAELVHNLLEPLDVLDLVDEEVLHTTDLERRLDQRLELVGRLHRVEAVPVEVKVDDVVLSDPRLLELPGDGLHEARLAALANSGEHLDHAVVVVEPANLLEAVLVLEQTHTGPNLPTGTGVANIAFIGVFLAQLTIYTPITAGFLLLHTPHKNTALFLFKTTEIRP